MAIFKIVYKKNSKFRLLIEKYTFYNYNLNNKLNIIIWSDNR
jgi:hypothetical protein